METNEFLSVVCKGFFQNMNMLYKEHNRSMEIIRKRFRRKLKQKIERNISLHQESMQRCIATFVEVAALYPRRPPSTSNVNTWHEVFESKTFYELLEYFQMDEEIFAYICEKLELDLKPELNIVRMSLAAKMKITIAMFTLCSSAEYRVVGKKFGVHKSTVKNCLYQFCDACIKVFLKDEIRMPDGDDLSNVINHFENTTGLPQVMGAIDITHINVFPTLNKLNEYMNPKGFPSIVLQAVVDRNYLFRDISCKYPGAMDESHIFKNSQLYKNQHELCLPQRMIDGKSIGPYIVGDPAYPLLPWLITPYSVIQTPEEESLNVYLNKASAVTETAFLKLKSRWKILQKQIKLDLNFVPRVITTCCILHNIVERRNVDFTSSSNESLALSDTGSDQPEVDPLMQVEGEEIRDHIKTYMSNNFKLLEHSNFDFKSESCIQQD